MICDKCIHYLGMQQICTETYDYKFPYHKACKKFAIHPDSKQNFKPYTLELDETEAKYSKLAFTFLLGLIKTGGQGILNIELAEKTLSGLINKLPKQVKEAEVFSKDFVPF